MTANELRVGNLVKQGKIKNFHENGIHIGYGKLYNFNDLEPIPITEELLLKFGFEKLTDVKDGFKETSYSYKRGVSFIVYFDGVRLSTNFWIGNEKKYVHQLQNLYHALTGEELI